MQKLHLLIVDPQQDFCNPDGALSVPGADKDMERLANMINRIQNKITDIHCTLDAHHLFDIAHPIFWKDSEENNPNPFTIITVADLQKGKWRASKEEYQDYAVSYLSQLEKNNRYPLCIWNPHCLIGTKGHTIVPVLSETLLAWEKNHIDMVNYVIKGSNFKTEHYSAVQADVPDPDDPSTMLNKSLLKRLIQADKILIAGEALSHCVKFTAEDIADGFDNKSHIRKMVLLEDCCSSVPGFEAQGRDFITRMTARGMKISNSIDFSL